MPRRKQQGESPPNVKPKRKTFKELVWEAVGAGLSPSGEGALISNPEALGSGLDPEAAKAELIARLEKRIAKLAGKAVRLGICEEMEDLRQKGIEALLRGLYYFARNWNGTPARFYTYMSGWLKKAIFERDFLWEKTVSLEAWHEKEFDGLVHMCPNRASGQGDRENRDRESTDPREADIRSNGAPKVFVPIDVNQKVFPDPFMHAELSLLWKRVALLPRRERIVLALRYKEGLTLRATGERMGGITREAVRQLEEKALGRLRNMLRGAGA